MSNEREKGIGKRRKRGKEEKRKEGKGKEKREKGRGGFQGRLVLRITKILRGECI
jgi:hypothetical protein